MQGRILLGALMLFAIGLNAQDLRLRKGQINENIGLQDSIGSRISVFLPSAFEAERQWPLLFVIDVEGGTEGGPSDPLRYFVQAAESNHFILATTGTLQDTVSLTKKVLHLAASLQKLGEILPVDPKRVYVGGIRGGGKLAGILPSMLKDIRGVLAIASGPPNGDLLSSRNRFDYVGILNRADQNYLPMLQGEASLASERIPSHVLYFVDTQAPLPGDSLLRRGFALFHLMAMKSGIMTRDSTFINAQYREYLGESSRLLSRGDFLLAEDRLEEALEVFEDLRSVDTLKAISKQIRRTEGYAKERKLARTIGFKERLLREDYDFYMEEDVLSFNLNNLGWWRHQMETIENYKKSWRPEEALMGFRLQSYLQALTDDFIRLARVEKPVDEDALILLHMLRTIIDPAAPEAYLTVISLTSKYGDQGTALFYLEELLKTGFDDKERLYSLEHTALLRISPEFNALIGEYLKDPRYDIPEVPEKG